MIKEFLSLHGDYSDKKYFRELTTIKMGGKIAHYVEPYNQEDLSQIVQFLRNSHYDYKILGNGSNLIAGSSDYDGVIISLNHFDDFKIEGTKVYAEAGVLAPYLAGRLAKEGLSGFEFASGIPGSIGGAIFMNAGAYKSDMGYIVKSVTVLTPELKVKELTNYDLDFHYRTSFIQKNPGYICLEATIILKKGNPEEILQLIDDRKKRRLESQPLEYPSAGSVFRNPEGDFAGRLIEESGLKGKQIGGAMVSTKHANFVINYGGATGKEIKELITLIKDTVKDKYNIDLKCEQEFVE